MDIRFIILRLAQTSAKTTRSVIVFAHMAYDIIKNDADVDVRRKHVKKVTFQATGQPRL